ncbi:MULTISPECIES: RadC family protein [Enterobacteriaceae]|uniref:RadC family protein n=1 Tax=Enterobacteriaceae TaxID=543 RepID=UPI000F82CDD3|nr:MULTISPECIES: DNA repair protein RadC [Enterobacter cloacae complex]MCE1278362.1 DNA repair protein RadC [Enterobacter hormaechei]MCE1314872.1 DNA repair protein RadC [Enterobacter hormaechei]MCK0257164.1 DNA repair protein RadC [Enterobacter hormaechei]MCK0266142.1 DNA repair protein RadC [Enterobacter hormaechei]MCU6300661.1 DNA repair protein RadC [Enterobacter cloacae]
MSTINLSPVFPANEQRVIQRALRLLEKYQRQPSESFTSTSLTKTWLQLQMAHLEREVFIVMYLDNQHCLLERETLFTGTLNHTEVHPREVVKSALKHNAAAVILAHNHPSGTTEISQQDKHVTQRIAKALALVEVRVLDHLVVGNEVVSFAECGLL